MLYRVVAEAYRGKRKKMFRQCFTVGIFDSLEEAEEHTHAIAFQFPPEYMDFLGCQRFRIIREKNGKIFPGKDTHAYFLMTDNHVFSLISSSKLKEPF